MPMKIYMAHENIYGPLKYVWLIKIYMAENIYAHNHMIPQAVDPKSQTYLI